MNYLYRENQMQRDHTKSMGYIRKKLLFKMVEVKTVKTIFIVTSIADFYLENNQNKVTADLK
jgi:hypothetical protein